MKSRETGHSSRDLPDEAEELSLTARKILELAAKKCARLTTAESCTGGLIASPAYRSARSRKVVRQRIRRLYRKGKM
ncbi:CinA family protein [Novosphingobium sp. Gsoil 351]|uniref:CinA family protein n=1 Tax=Novosphingobium sp. Gsoil 351 TaxID=2675225 RepID=UPI0012B4E489|nr:hypothetical protein GKE62_15650 [Novosphingobium sp. Gsoil 351]